MSALTDAYRDQGWQLCAIPPGEKGPTYAGWNDAGLDYIPEGMNVGLLHTLSGTAALDIDDMELATGWLAERGVDLQSLLDAPDAVRIISGRTGSAKLLYQLSIPLPSKKVLVPWHGKQKTALEFRCASAEGKSVQDVLPPSKHPSGSTYRWGGAGEWHNLPPLPPQLFDLWAGLLAEVPAAASSSATPPSLEEVKDALSALDPDMDRESWIQLGFAVHDAATKVGDLDAGFAIWDDWSSQSEKYRANEMAGQWRSIKDKSAGQGITVATLFKAAYDAGWQKPPPDIRGMFGPVKEQPAQAVKDMMSPPAEIPPTDVSMWPAKLVKRALEVSEEVGCDVVVPLLAGLAAVSAVADKRMGLRISRTWCVPPVFWTMTVGEPSDKKTPGSKPMLLPLRKIEAEDKSRYEADMLGYLGKEARYAAQVKAYREWSASPEAELPGAIPPRVDPIPVKPEPLRLLVTDSTSQKLVGLAQYRPRGFLVWLDEMHNWLGKMGPRSGEDRGCWIQLYETGPYTMDRVGAGTIHAENLAGSIFGNCQPEVFRTHAKEVATDGLLQRFLPIVLTPDKTVVRKRDIPEFFSSDREYSELLKSIYRLPAFEYVMEPAGDDDFHTFEHWCHDIRKLERLTVTSNAYQTALGKLEGHCARLILICHLINDPHSPFISQETVRQGIVLIHRFFLPMIRHTFLEVANQRDATGEAVFEHVLQLAGVKETVKLGELRRAVAKVAAFADKPPQFVDLMIRVAMDELTELNHVAMHEDHPRNPCWAINPVMAEVFADHRREVILGKQARIDKFRADIMKGTGKPARVGDAVGFHTI